MTQKVLIISPHTDDGEIGCGGTIVRFLEEKKEVYYAVFSMCEKSVPKGFPKDALKKELFEALKLLGIKQKNIFIFNYAVRDFPEYRQKILEDLIKLKDKIKPNMVFTPTSDDVHQDHKTAFEETVRAFKQVSILGYEQPWNNIIFKTNMIIELQKEHIEKKYKALECYKTQKHRHYLNKEYVFSLAKTRGTQIQKDYAEAFEVIRWVI